MQSKTLLCNIKSHFKYRPYCFFFFFFFCFMPSSIRFIYMTSMLMLFASNKKIDILQNFFTFFEFLIVLHNLYQISQIHAVTVKIMIWLGLWCKCKNRRHTLQLTALFILLQSIIISLDRKESYNYYKISIYIKQLLFT